MNKVNLLAGSLFVAGLVMALFGLIGSITNQPTTLTTMDIISITESGARNWAESITISSLQNAVMTFIDIPLWILILSLGVLIFIVNGLFSKN